MTTGSTAPGGRSSSGQPMPDIMQRLVEQITRMNQNLQQTLQQSRVQGNQQNFNTTGTQVPGSGMPGSTPPAQAAQQSQQRISNSAASTTSPAQSLQSAQSAQQSQQRISNSAAPAGSSGGAPGARASAGAGSGAAAGAGAGGAAGGMARMAYGMMGGHLGDGADGRQHDTAGHDEPGRRQPAEPGRGAREECQRGILRPGPVEPEPPHDLPCHRGHAGRPHQYLLHVRRRRCGRQPEHGPEHGSPAGRVLRCHGDGNAQRGCNVRLCSDGHGPDGSNADEARRAPERHHRAAPGHGTGAARRQPDPGAP